MSFSPSLLPRNTVSEESISTKYERSNSLAQRIKATYTDTTISPHWTDKHGIKSVWYRKNTAPDQFVFVLVDVDTDWHSGSLCRLAFDHEGLAKALNDQGIEANEGSLPFTFIDPGSDDEGAFIRFVTEKGKKWQFRETGTLTQYDGDVDQEGLKPMLKETPSEKTGESTSITFINRTQGPLSLFWLDGEGTPKFYVTVEAGQSNRRPTYSGHVWRVSNSKTENLIASFFARDVESTAVIEDWMSSITEPIDKSITKPSSGKDSSAGHGDPGAFVRNYNVWVRDSEGGETQLSTSGTKENPFDEDSIHPSKDGSFAVVWQYTPHQEHIVYEVESSPKDQLQPRLKQFQYLKPGDKVRIDRPKMFDLKGKREIAADDKLFRNPYHLKDMGWSNDGGEYRFWYNQRGHQIFRLIGINTRGAVRSIIEETSKTFVDYSQKNYSYEIEESNEMIWASERDGWNHLYLFDLKTGKLKNQITKGEWMMRSVDTVDKAKRQIWFRAFGVIKGQDPYYAHLARANFDGSDFTILTQGDGSHTWSWSPDRQYLSDTWSRVDLPPQTVLRNSKDGRQIVMLQKEEEGSSCLEKLEQVGWTPVERFAAPGRDGKTMIYGIIIRPSNFDKFKKYPVIEQVYAGPQDFYVPKTFSTLVKMHELAELGFIVVQIDGMGTNWRSKAYHDICYKNLKDAGFLDRIAWMKAAAAEEVRPWMDLSRVGIFGGSAGGQNAMAALLWHGDFYKAAFADCGCHDNRMDKMWWNEQWMGWPVDASYEESSNVVHARKLKGALMLCLGELDENVDPSSTMQVVHALNEAEKDYDFLFRPGAGHGSSSSAYVARRMRDFFVRHLLGIEPRGNN
jgi:dipeptidyl-peptidase-4